MIEAARSRWFSWWFSGTAIRSMRKQFSAVWLGGQEHLRALPDCQPLLCIANHSSWWDGMAVLWLNRDVLDREGYALMDAANLRRYRFFRKAGGFGVDMQSRRDGAAALRYGAGLLRAPGNAVWVFPQGREEPAHAPLRFRAGASRLARLAPDAAVIPVGLRYVFGSRPRPQMYVNFGAPLPETTRASVDAQRGAVADALRRVDQHLLDGAGDFALGLGRAKPSHSRAARWLDRLVGWTLPPESGDQTAIGAEPQLPAAPLRLSDAEG